MLYLSPYRQPVQNCAKTENSAETGKFHSSAQNFTFRKTVVPTGPTHRERLSQWLSGLKHWL